MGYENLDAHCIPRFIEAIKDNNPELRIGQIVINAAYTGGWRDPDPFHCPDSVLLKGLIQMWEDTYSKNKGK